MIDFLAHHQFWAAVAIYWIFSAAIGSMPEPGSCGGAGYLWAYRFLHTLAGNISTAFGGKIPGLKALALIGLIPLLVTPACAARYAMHPGSVNKIDSMAYDALLVAQSVIDAAKAENEAAPLPERAKDALNKLVQAYNVARDTWLVYRDAPAQIDADRLLKNLAELAAATRSFKEAR